MKSSEEDVLDNMLRKMSIGLLILVMSIVMVGCGNKAKVENQPQNPPSEQTQPPEQTPPKPVYLTPIPEGKPLGESNLELSQQLMAQKDVLGAQIYEQQGITYGDLTFNSAVDKAYAKQLLNEYMTQMKINYPGNEIIVQGIIDGQVFDSVSSKP